MDYYIKTTRSMPKAAKEIGAKPFILFQYYSTYSTAPGGIHPSLATIAKDLDLTPIAVCNLRKLLIDAGWIRFENGEVYILKSFTKNEDHSQKMNRNTQRNESIIHKK